MEATRVYWIPLFHILEARALEVYLFNPRNLKKSAAGSFTTTGTSTIAAAWLTIIVSYKGK